MFHLIAFHAVRMPKYLVMAPVRIVAAILRKLRRPGPREGEGS